MLTLRRVNLGFHFQIQLQFRQISSARDWGDFELNSTQAGCVDLAISAPTVISNNGETAIFSNKLVVMRNMPALTRGVFGGASKTVFSIDVFTKVFKVGLTLSEAKLKRRAETLKTPSVSEMRDFLSSLFGRLAAVSLWRSRS
jgi:hypothetical protein